ncbi:MAG: serine/threonine-protein phosphatase [Chloroflexi bacterium]|nr:serine/threonine-protein phosphatase [Chloroflexota bacterium]
MWAFISTGDEPEQQAQQHQGLPLAAGDIILLCSDGLIKERRNQPGNFCGG